MNKEKKDHFPWETMDTTTLMIPEELITYHICRLEEDLDSKREKGIKENRAIIVSYLNMISPKKEDESPCSQR